MKAIDFPASQHYSFESLDEGVSYGRARREGTALSNTGVVDLGDATLVFDTSLTLHSARDIHEAAKVVTGRIPSLAVNSHWHLDHLLGNQVFADRPIYATRRTVEILLEKRAELEGELTREKLEAEVRELEKQRAAIGSEFGRAQYDAVLRVNRTLLDEAPEIRLTLPTIGFERELKLPGPRNAEVVTFGAGHTDSDAVLFLPKSAILFAGDLVVSGTHPNLTSGDPEHWITVLDEIERLKPERVVTGHGSIGSVDTLETMRDYLSTVLELARDAREPAVPSRFASFTEPDQFTANVAYARSRFAKRK